MSLEPGQLLGPYKVGTLIGEGGMGQVWQATDTQLGREVALKILPDAFAADPDRLSRFQREAQILASLNHPNIAAIHGIEEAEGTRALVLELVEGPTLADCIAAGSLSPGGGEGRGEGGIPIEDALPIASQIAEALEAAHEAGVIHRDLKPANIKVREDGTVKVLDFGLAKALDPSPDADPSQSPTLTAAATQMGVIMGTAAYMSPEQARGQSVDKRADIWAFGAVLFEMLTGRRAFEGEDVSTTLADVIRADVPWERLPERLPPALGVYLRRCLEKDSRQRIRDIGDLRLALSGALDVPVEIEHVPAAAASLTGWRQALPFALSLALVASVVTALLTWVATREEPSAEPTRRFVIQQPTSARLGGRGPTLRVSPDGQTIVYGARSGGEVQLYQRSMDRLQPAPVRDTIDAAAHAFSPDSEWLVFEVPAERVVRRVALAGGAAVDVVQETDDLDVIGVAWGPDETVVLGTTGGGLHRVPLGGGPPEAITTPRTEGEFHMAPSFVPGSSDVVFTVRRGDDVSIGVYASGSGEWRELGEGALAKVSLGHLVYSRGDSIWAMPFDQDRLEILDEAMLVVDEVATLDDFPAGAHFDVVADGTLVYVPSSTVVSSLSLMTRQLRWMTRDGVGSTLDGLVGYFNPRISPSGDRALLQKRDPDGNTVWMLDVDRGSVSPFAVAPPYNGFPIWTRMLDCGRQFFEDEPHGHAGGPDCGGTDVQHDWTLQRSDTHPQVQLTCQFLGTFRSRSGPPSRSIPMDASVPNEPSYSPAGQSIGIE